MRQDPDEPFLTFAARVQGKAETSEFQTTTTVFVAIAIHHTMVTSTIPMRS